MWPGRKRLLDSQLRPFEWRRRRGRPTIAPSILLTGRSRGSIFLAAATAVLTLVASNGGGGASAVGAPVATGLRTCFDQSEADRFIGIISQNFEASFDQYDAQGADDFTLKKTCRVTMVMAYGTYYAGGGPLRSENVTFYRDRSGVPGRVISNQSNLEGEGDGLGSVTIDLESPVRLRPGRYWVSVQGNMDFAAGGQWGWYTHEKQRGNLATWRNPGDGFGTGCVGYTPTRTCFDNGQGPDFVFMLRGR